MEGKATSPPGEAKKTRAICTSSGSSAATLTDIERADGKSFHHLLPAD